jgi:hypothetical protein
VTAIVLVGLIFLGLTGAGLAIELKMPHGPGKRRLIERINQVSVVVACVMFGLVVVLTGFYLGG